MNTVCANPLLDYWQLTKPKLVFLVLLAVLLGMFMASEKSIQIYLLVSVFVGTALAAAGAQALNQWMEHSQDAKMSRTMNRPIPSGRLKPFRAFLFGLTLSLAGLVLIFKTTNLLCFFLTAMTLVSYLLIYTPLKRITPLCTYVGAIPGALPPLIGWSAVTGTLRAEGWILFAILFLWQLPHFFALSWTYRKDYKAADFRMLSVQDSDGRLVARHIVFYALLLCIASLSPTWAGLAASLYFFAALLLGLAFIIFAAISMKQLDQKARNLFHFSNLYLVCLMFFMVIDKT